MWFQPSPLSTTVSRYWTSAILFFYILLFFSSLFRVGRQVGRLNLTFSSPVRFLFIVTVLDKTGRDVVEETKKCNLYLSRFDLYTSRFFFSRKRSSWWFLINCRVSLAHDDSNTDFFASGWLLRMQSLLNNPLQHEMPTDTRRTLAPEGVLCSPWAKIMGQIMPALSHTTDTEPCVSAFINRDSKIIAVC